MRLRDFPLWVIDPALSDDEDRWDDDFPDIPDDYEPTPIEQTVPESIPPFDPNEPIPF